MYCGVPRVETMDSRDDANLRHFKSRAIQPKVSVGKSADGIAPVNTRQPKVSGRLYYTNPPVDLMFVFDTPFNTRVDEIDDLRFRHLGRGRQIDYTGAMRTKRACMKDSFMI